MKPLAWKNLYGSLARHLSLPMSLVALTITAASYCSDQSQVAESRAITQSIVWRAEPLGNDEGVRLQQPNAAVAVQRVTLTFPTIARADPLSLPPSRAEVRGAWIEAGMTQALRGCATKDNVVVLEGQLPVFVQTSYHVANNFRTATSVYTLSYLATISDLGLVTIQVEDFSIAAVDLANKDLVDQIRSWRPDRCTSP